MKNRIATVALWVSRCIGVLVIGLIFFLPAIVDWSCSFRMLTDEDQTVITACCIACVIVICGALWNVDRILTDVLAGQVFTRKNALRIRRIVWCCGGVSLISAVAAFAYMPLIFLVIIMAFLCLMVSVMAGVMDAAVAIREENDLTV